MMTILNRYCIFFCLSAISFSAKGQKLKIKNYSIGYRVFEVDAVGNNPTTVSSLLKNRAAYENFFKSIKYNSLWGNPAILHYHTFYINGEWYKDNATSAFWKRYTLQGGAFLTSTISQDAGAVADEHFDSTYTVKYVNKYSLTKKQQFFGANAGVNRRFKLSKKLQFLAGFHTQGAFAFVHHYKQQWDSSTWKSTTGWNTNTTQLPNLKGRRFFQYQIMIPLGLEYELYKERFFVRIEVEPGIIGSKYRPNTSSSKEAHGAGIWFVFTLPH